MPIKPVSGMRPLPVDSPDDVAALVDLLERPGADVAGLADHFAYLAGVRPEWLRPHQERIISGSSDRIGVGFGDLCLLLAGAPDRCVEQLTRRLRQNRSFYDAWALAAIGTETALAAVAEDVGAGGDRRDYEDCGIWVPPAGPADCRAVTCTATAWN